MRRFPWIWFKSLAESLHIALNGYVVLVMDQFAVNLKHIN
jgi:hypothetical protein